MTTGKTLPFHIPTVTCWSWQAGLFSIIQDIPEAKDWIYSNYIQLYCHPDPGNIHNVFMDFIPSYNNFLECPILDIQYMERKFIIDIYDNVIDFFKYCIDNDYYIYTVINEKWIFDSDKDFYHEAFIYGYDNVDRTFNIADFTLSNTRKYSSKKIGYDKISKGFLSVDKNDDFLLRGDGGILLVKINVDKKLKFIFDINQVKIFLEDYLSAKNNLFYFSGKFNRVLYDSNYRGEISSKSPDPLFGINIYYALRDHLVEPYNYLNWDIRPFHNLYEHKKLMKERIEYMILHRYIPNTDSFISDAAELEKMTNILCNRILKEKFKKAGNDIFLEECMAMLMDIRNKEISLYNGLISVIEIK